MEALLQPGPYEDKVLGEADAPVTIVEYASIEVRPAYSIEDGV